MADEGVLDPWVAQWLEQNPIPPFEDFSPEMLALARSDFGTPPAREIAKVTDREIAGVPVRVYEHDEAPTGLVVYFHGGAFCIGSIGLMDNVARELAYATGATVISVEYRLAPEHPFPAGLDDCEAVTRWAIAHASDFGAAPDRVVVAGESAGGNLSAAVSLRLRGDTTAAPAGQVLMYPVVAGFAERFPSRDEFDGVIINTKSPVVGDAYMGGRDLDRDPFVAPLAAESLAGLPPAIVVLGGCDPLRDEGRLYAQRLDADGVAVEELCCAGQPHGFINFGFPAAALAFERIGAFVRARFAAQAS
jgi:acetyl esterase/lipase